MGRPWGWGIELSGGGVAWPPPPHKWGSPSPCAKFWLKKAKIASLPQLEVDDFFLVPGVVLDSPSVWRGGWSGMDRKA